MAMAKVSLSLDEDVLTQVRARAGRRQVSAYVNEILRWQLQRERLQELLDDMEERTGPIPEDLVADARKLWRDR